MAYIDRGNTGNTGNRDSHGWAIAAAFAGQAAIIVAIGALVGAVGSHPEVAQVSAGPVPGVAQPAQPVPGFSAIAQPEIQPQIPYSITIDGQRGSDTFPSSSSVPAFTVKPGQDLTVSLVTVPPYTVSSGGVSTSLTGMSWDLVGPSSDVGTSVIRTPYNDSVQAQSPGTYVYQLNWPGSASELQPGTKWMLVMSTGGTSSPIATITVAS